MPATLPIDPEYIAHLEDRITRVERASIDLLRDTAGLQPFSDEFGDLLRILPANTDLNERDVVMAILQRLYPNL